MAQTIGPLAIALDGQGPLYREVALWLPVQWCQKQGMSPPFEQRRTIAGTETGDAEIRLAVFDEDIAACFPRWPVQTHGTGRPRLHALAERPEPQS